MKKYLIIASALIITLLVVTIITSDKKESVKSNAGLNGKISDKSKYDSAATHSISETGLSFFIDTVTAIVKTQTKDYDKLGLGGGVDGFVLMKTFSGLIPSDFRNVIAIGGEYSVLKGELSYTGNMASNSAVLRREGMKTLLQNCLDRLRLNADTKESVTQILNVLRKRNSAS